MDVAEKLRVAHKQQHPDYKYQPRRKKSKKQIVTRSLPLTVEREQTRQSSRSRKLGVSASYLKTIDQRPNKYSTEGSFSTQTMSACEENSRFSVAQANDTPPLLLPQTITCKAIEPKIIQSNDHYIKPDFSSPNSYSNQDQKSLNPATLSSSSNIVSRPMSAGASTESSSNTNSREFHNSCILNDNANNFYYRNDTLMSRRFSNYGVEHYANCYSHQVQAYPLSTAFTQSDSFVSALSSSQQTPLSYTQFYSQQEPQPHCDTVGNTSTLDMDIDPREMDQYLHNQIRRFSVPVYHKTFEHNHIETNPNQLTFSKFDTHKIADTIETYTPKSTPDNLCLTENTYAHIHQPWDDQATYKEKEEHHYK